jgi:hypothetical protein
MVTIEVDQYDSSHPMLYWNLGTSSWTLAPGAYTVYLGNSSSATTFEHGRKDHDKPVAEDAQKVCRIFVANSADCAGFADSAGSERFRACAARSTAPDDHRSDTSFAQSPEPYTRAVHSPDSMPSSTARLRPILLDNL